MEGFIWTLFWIYFGGMFISSIYFWFTKTNSSSSPRARRFAAMMHGYAWPYHVIHKFTGSASKEDAELEAAKKRILGSPGTGAPQSEPPTQPPNKIANPFD